MKTAVIVNPVAGGSRTGKLWHKIEPAIRRTYPETTLLRTERAGDEIRLGKKVATDGTDMVMVVGGDGTLNGVVNGLLSVDGAGSALPAIAPIPFGTGGDFARGLGFTGHSVDEIEKLPSLEPISVDVGKVTFEEDGRNRDRYWLNQSYIGIGARVVDRVNRSSHLSGSRAYTLASIREAWRLQFSTLDITFPGKPPERKTVVNLLVANGKYSGGGMLTAPSASLSDGLFEVAIVGREAVTGATPRLKLLKNLSKFKDGTYLSMAGVSSTRAPSLAVAGNREEFVEADGEIIGHLPVRYRILPSALKFYSVGSSQDYKLGK